VGVTVKAYMGCNVFAALKFLVSGGLRETNHQERPRIGVLRALRLLQFSRKVIFNDFSS